MESSGSGGDSGRVISLLDLLVIVRKHIVTVIVAFVVVVACGSGYTFIAPPKYTARAQVIATFNSAQESENGTDITQQNTGGTYISSQITSYPTLATTGTVLQPVINELHLDKSVKELAEQLTVNNPTNTAFVNISTTDGDAERAAAIANAVAKSLQNVVENDLYVSNNGQSPIKVSIVQKADVPDEPEVTYREFEHSLIKPRLRNYAVAKKE